MTLNFNSFLKIYKKSSIWGKILIFIVIMLLLVIFFKHFTPIRKEGFTQETDFLVKSGDKVYDKFYADIYDYLVYNDVKDNYEVGEIINKTTPTSNSIILDVGSGTGNHVAEFAARGFKIIGIDKSPSMIDAAKKKYPNYDFKEGDATNATEFQPSSFTHILCLYFTIYYMPDKKVFFENCMNWLMPGGYLLVHLVDRDEFDPILPPGNPLALISPQRYAKERITTTKLKFTDFGYSANFKLDPTTNKAIFEEKFKNDSDGKVRKNEHIMYMENHNDILQIAQNCGFILQGQIDMLECQYEYQYVYVLQKPE